MYRNERPCSITITIQSALSSPLLSPPLPVSLEEWEGKTHLCRIGLSRPFLCSLSSALVVLADAIVAGHGAGVAVGGGAVVLAVESLTGTQ